MKYNLNFFRCLLGFIVLMITLSGCKSYQNIAYFKDLPDSVRSSETSVSEYSQPVIQTDDILSIIVQTIDPENSSVVNQTVMVPTIGSAGMQSVGNQVAGFLVDRNGDVELAMVGKIKLAGLTTDQARDLIKERVARFYKNPSVQVRFANFKVTLIGEVTKPATYTMPNEKVSIFDALGAAGDLTIYGKRENVLLIRDNAGKKQFVRFNLNSSDIFKSPFYYLKQNDIVYVEPTKGKAATTDAARNRTITIIASVLSLAIVAVSRLL